MLKYEQHVKVKHGALPLEQAQRDRLIQGQVQQARNRGNRGLNLRPSYCKNHGC